MNGADAALLALCAGDPTVAATTLGIGPTLGWAVELGPPSPRGTQLYVVAAEL